MGAEESVLKSVEVGEPYSQLSFLSKLWSTVAPARYFRSQLATVFIKEFDEEQEDLAEVKKFLECGIQTLKSLRHPRIVKYLDRSVTSTNVCLIVERLRPLEYSLDDDFEKDEVLSGLCDIFNAVHFLHDKAGLSHNNIGPVAVFISPDGTWKLGSFECAQKLENCLHWCQTVFAKHAKDESFVPPEDQKMMYSNVPVYARDVFGLGKLVDFLMPSFQNKLDEVQRNDITRFIEQLTTEEAAKRPVLSETNWRFVFRNDLYDIGDFIRELPLKTAEEKNVFFRDLTSKLERLSPRVIAKRLSKSLLSRFVLLEPDAVTHFLPQFLTYAADDSGLLSAHLFKQYVVPELKKVFCVHETAVRLSLLQYFDQYCESFDDGTLKHLILPELLLGMKDSDEAIVAASMRCLAHLVPFLGAEAVTGLKHTKYFCEGRPRQNEMPDLSKLTSVKDTFAASASHGVKHQVSSLGSNGPFHISKESLSATSVKENKESVPAMRGAPMRPSVISIKPELESISEKSSPVTVETMPLSPGEEEKPDSEWIDWDSDDVSKVTEISVESPGYIPATPVFPPVDHRTSSRQDAGKSMSTDRLKPLGAEFDVLAIEIAATATAALEDDLFAEMAPKITATRKKLEELAVMSPSSKFQASANIDDQEVGWDDAQLSNANDE